MLEVVLAPVSLLALMFLGGEGISPTSFSGQFIETFEEMRRQRWVGRLDVACSWVRCGIGLGGHQTCGLHGDVGWREVLRGVGRQRRCGARRQVL
ncbi:hypothetical protein [Nocardia farcinica]